jgi:hypothetical protein
MKRIKLIIIWSIAGLLFFMMAILAAFEPNNEKLENQHECTTYIKYQEHYQVTPMTWYYRDSFKCIECGKDWKD